MTHLIYPCWSGHSARCILLGIALAVPFPGFSGVHGDTLNRCFSSATSERDKFDILRWTFGVLSVHPSLTGTSRPSAITRDDFDKRVARLVERLITEQCASEVRVALIYEGRGALRVALDTLFRGSVTSILEDSAVKEEMGAFVRQLDIRKFESALSP